MASSLYPSTQFVVSAGCILFRRGEEGKLEICVLHDRKKDEWVLPKGRKDCGESIEAAAVGAKPLFEDNKSERSIGPRDV
jgi:8-oxo-dGTP pyrophosphatase MutT (NUDIX family)